MNPTRSALIDTALEQFGGVRWIIALTGLRQGELLAVHWTELTSMEASSRSSTASQTRYRHGCNLRAASTGLVPQQGADQPRTR